MSTQNNEVMTQVVHPKFGQGTIISEANGNVTIEFAEFTKTLIVKYAGLNNIDGTPYGEQYTSVATATAPAKLTAATLSKSAARRAKAKSQADAFDAMSNLDKIKSAMMNINGKCEGDRSSLGYTLWFERIGAIEYKAKQVGDSFITGVCESVIRTAKCSEKQAFVIARFADNNGITY